VLSLAKLPCLTSVDLSPRGCAELTDASLCAFMALPLGSLKLSSESKLSSGGAHPLGSVASGRRWCLT